MKASRSRRVAIVILRVVIALLFVPAIGVNEELHAIVRPQHPRQTARHRQGVEHARHRHASQRARRHHRDGFGGGVVDDRQALQDAAFRGAIEDEVRRPHVVRSLRPGERLTIGQGNLLASPAPDLQPRLGVEPIHPLVIDVSAFLAQLQVDHAGTVPAVTVRQRHDAIAQAGIGIRPWHIPQRGGTHARHG
jgi:hypothetical protein